MYVAVASLIGGQALLCPGLAIVVYLVLFAVAVTAFVRFYERLRRSPPTASRISAISRRSHDGATAATLAHADWACMTTPARVLSSCGRSWTMEVLLP